MYILTILGKRTALRSVEYYEPPTTVEIERELAKHDGEEDISFDIARKPLEDSDIDEHLEEI